MNESPRSAYPPAHLVSRRRLGLALGPINPRSAARAPGTSRRWRHAQAGLSIVEALVALAVLALGTMGLMHGQSVMTASSAAARQTLDAVHRIRSAMEADRAPSGVIVGSAPGSGLRALRLDTVARTTAGTGLLGTTLYTLRWIDRDGTPRAWSLTAQSAAPDLEQADFFVGGVGGAASAPVGVGVRAVGIPPDATNLDETTGLWPTAAGGLAGWVFDRASGHLIGTCPAITPSGSGVGPGTGGPPSGGGSSPVGDARRDGVRLPPGCLPVAARIVGGVVRFALGDAPTSDGPFDSPLPLHVTLVDRSGRPQAIGCDITVVRTVDPHLGWRCAWPTAAATGSAGPEPVFQPEGWSFGGAGATHRLCRYRDAETRADAPGWPRWLVVRAALPCPDGTVPGAAAQSGA